MVLGLVWVAVGNDLVDFGIDLGWFWGPSEVQIFGVTLSGLPWAQKSIESMGPRPQPDELAGFCAVAESLSVIR